MARVVVLGSANTDLVLRVERLPAPGETVLGGAIERLAGGKGANQAVAAARAGARVSFLGAVGADDFGCGARNSLANERINISYCEFLSGATSGVALILVDGAGQNQIAVSPGANALISPEWIEQLPDAVFAGPGVFVAQLEIPLGSVFTALARAKNGGMRTILNPAPANEQITDSRLLQSVDLLVANESESEALGRSLSAKVKTDPERSLFEAAGLSEVIVTLGDKGYILSRHGKNECVPGHSVRALDTVAAGDTFVGALAARLSMGLPLDLAARWANAAAAIAVTRPGAQASIPYAEEVEEFIRKGYGDAQ